MTNNVSLHSVLAAVCALLAVKVSPAAETAALVVITTASGERFVGVMGSEDVDAVRIISRTLGEVRVPRSAIVNLTRGVGEAPDATAAPAVAAAPVAAPAAAPKRGFLQSHLGIPGQFDATIGLGLMAQSGAIDQTSWTGSGSVTWKAGANLLQSAVQTRRQMVRQQVIDDSFRWDNRLQHDLTPKYFLLAAGIYQENTAMAIKQEEIVFFGPGVNWFKTPAWEVMTLVGPAYMHQRYLSPGPGFPVAPSLSNGAAVLHQTLSYAAMPRWRFSGSFLILQSIEDSGKQVANLILALDVALSENLSLSNSYTWMRDSHTRLGAKQTMGMLSSQLQLKL